MNYRDIKSPTHGLKLAVVCFCLIFSLLGQPSVTASRFNASAEGSGGGRNRASYHDAGGYGVAQGAPGHASIVVKIKPRHMPDGSTAGDGSSSISLLDGAGSLIATYEGSVPLNHDHSPRYDGRAVGVKGPHRDIQNGDTPFGVYRYSDTQGGTNRSELGTGYGRGKVIVNVVYGDVADVHRDLIRLHGGGTGLPDPYALEQGFKPTLGCVRMRNGDVNDLIQFIKSLPAAKSLRYVFMGSDDYLRRTLAGDMSLSNRPWWSVLLTDLGIPLPQPPPQPPMTELIAWTRPAAHRQEAGGGSAQDAQIIELVKLFSEDVGKEGRDALTQLQPHVDAMQGLQRSLPSDDPMQPRLAFALCYLGHDCESNLEVIKSALKEDSPYKEFPAEEAASMLSRLIDTKSESDEQATEMMGTLFESAKEADGALSEGLGVTFSDKLRSRTRVFISAFKELYSPALRERSAGVRTRVRELISMVGYLTLKDLNRVRQKMDALHDSSQEFNEAVRELKEDIRELKDKYIQAYRERRARRRSRR